MRNIWGGKGEYRKMSNFKSENSKLECSCIIATFNEGKRLNDVLDILTRVKNLLQIIVIDDGTDNYSQSVIHSLVKKNKVLYIKLHKNTGKSGAIKEGLKYLKTNYVMTCDADLRNLNKNEFEEAIEKIITDQSIDMIILKRIHAKFESKWIRADTIFSGERILRKTDLLEVFKTNPQGYQIEIAINEYMTDHHKKVYWMPSSATNVFKRDKVGWFQGTINEQKMHLSLMKYAGIWNYIKQTLFFCRKRMLSFLIVF